MTMTVNGKLRLEDWVLPPKSEVVRALPGNLVLGSLTRVLFKAVAASERDQHHRQILSGSRKLRPGIDATLGLV